MTGKPEKYRDNGDDIPEALREKSSLTKQKSSLLGVRVIAVIGLGAIAATVGFFLLRPNQQVATTPLPLPTPTQTSPPLLEERGVNNRGTPSLTPTPTPTPVDNLLGHLTYKVAPEKELMAITTDGRVRLRKTSATEFLRMQAAAKAAGVSLSPLSGFRSLKEQEYLFFKVKEKLAEAATKRAELSAPPGYSEHHTGYAIDIGDGRAPGLNLRQDFEKTAAFRWLQKNAAKYSFELSFPRDNLQGVSYEPWHWRFVGDRDSLETFYKAKNLQLNRSQK